jgi:hypothetical protein
VSDDYGEVAAELVKAPQRQFSSTLTTRAMSAFGTKRCRSPHGMSAFGGKADIPKSEPPIERLLAVRTGV